VILLLLYVTPALGMYILLLPVLPYSLVIMSNQYINIFGESIELWFSVLCSAYLHVLSIGEIYRMLEF